MILASICRISFIIRVDITKTRRYYHRRLHASVAQSVEHSHGKAGVIGSSPIGGFFPVPLLTCEWDFFVREFKNMAKSKKGAIDKIALQCSECNRKNYTTTKNRRNIQGKMEFNKYCKWDRKVTLHKEAKIK